MDSLNDLISILKKLPGLGTKSSRRIAYHLLKQDDKFLSELGRLISELKKDLRVCKVCGNLSYKNPCSICSDQMRDTKTICIVEDVESLSAFEQAGVYNGVYHVLGSRVSPIEGEELSDEAIKSLTKHIKANNPDEIIVATSPAIEGDLTYYALLELFRKLGVKKVSRIAYGLPVGGSIEFADRMTLHTALDSRRQVI